MKSRITIEVDYENSNEAVIQILSRNSEDIRDGLIKSFYQKLGNSKWCKIYFKQDFIDHDEPEKSFKRIFITPLSETEFKKEAETMREYSTFNDFVPH